MQLSDENNEIVPIVLYYLNKILSVDFFGSHDAKLPPPNKRGSF